MHSTAQNTYVKDSAEELSNNRHSDLDLSVHTAKDDRQIGTNKKLDVRNRNADATDNLVEDRCQHLRRAVILTDVLCRNVRHRKPSPKTETLTELFAARGKVDSELGKDHRDRLQRNITLDVRMRSSCRTDIDVRVSGRRRRSSEQGEGRSRNKGKDAKGAHCV